MNKHEEIMAELKAIKAEEPIYWLSPPPENCDTCGAPIGKVFYDARTRRGPWACMCPTCQTLGPGMGRVGTGFGQEYRKKGGKWVCTAGAIKSSE